MSKIELANFTTEKSLEIARTVGQPIDPRNPYLDAWQAIAETYTVNPDEHFYYHAVTKATDKVYVVTSTGTITNVAVSTIADTELTFADVVTPEYQVKFNDLARAKEATLARKRRDIEMEMNAYEIKYLYTLLDAACTSSGNEVTLGSGVTTYQLQHVISQYDQIADYGDKMVLYCGATCHSDIIKWNWTDNKNIDIFETFKKLNIEVKRMPNQTLSVDGAGAAAIWVATKAYLIATNSNSSTGQKPLLFARRKISDIDVYGAAIFDNGEKPERMVLVSPMPVMISTTRSLSLGLTGYEQIIAAVTNSYAVSEFSRA